MSLTLSLAKTSAIAARIAAPLAGIGVGLALLFLVLISDLRVSRSNAVLLLFMYSLLFAALSGAYARWDLIAARLFAATTSVMFFGPLALLLFDDIRYRWSKIYPDHLLLLCCYVAVGLASPLISLVAVQIVRNQLHPRS
ncbi:MAG: hypothetical protein QOD26_2171 [Betaproteobacteria bacterium]|nr:hypothetical protein [Betaproteobacteria bacterium]